MEGLKTFASQVFPWIQDKLGNHASKHVAIYLTIFNIPRLNGRLSVKALVGFQRESVAKVATHSRFSGFLVAPTSLALHLWMTSSPEPYSRLTIASTLPIPCKPSDALTQGPNPAYSYFEETHAANTRTYNLKEDPPGYKLGCAALQWVFRLKSWPSTWSVLLRLSFGEITVMKLELGA